jgi:hypothetical protein
MGERPPIGGHRTQRNMIFLTMGCCMRVIDWQRVQSMGNPTFTPYVCIYSSMLLLLHKRALTFGHGCIPKFDVGKMYMAYGDRSKTHQFKFSLRVCGELWGSLKPASRKFRARPAQVFAQGKL